MREGPRGLGEATGRKSQLGTGTAKWGDGGSNLGDSYSMGVDGEGHLDLPDL